MLIAEESTAWPKVTGSVKEDGLGFDYKWNMGWMNDFLGYMKCDPYFRCHHYGELTFSMIYAYSEDFILVFSHDEVVHGKGSMAGKMPGDTFEAKFANLRAAYGFMMGHPGKKLLFMGQEFGQMDEWNENKSLEWELLQYPVHRNMQTYVRALNHFYTAHPALYREDYTPDGFEWINCMDSANNIVVFLRKTEKPEETLLFVCNFAPVEHPKYQIGVPFAGKYKEIFNSESEEFGGCGVTNPRVKNSKEEEHDGREDSITVRIAPLGISVFSCTPGENRNSRAAAPAKRTKSAKSRTGAGSAKKTAGRKKTAKMPETAVPAEEENASKDREDAGEERESAKGQVITFKADKSLYGALADLKDDEVAIEKLKKEMENRQLEPEGVVKKARKAQKAARKKAQEAADTLIATVNGVKKAAREKIESVQEPEKREEPKRPVKQSEQAKTPQKE